MCLLSPELERCLRTAERHQRRGKYSRSVLIRDIERYGVQPAAIELTATQPGSSQPWFRIRADSKCQLGFSRGCRIAIASSAVTSCITACSPSRIELNPARRSRFSAAVRSVASTPAPLPR